MDPLEGRFVLHGHISEQGPAAAGALPPGAAVEPARAAIKAFTDARFVEGYQGVITVQLDVQADGGVASCHILLDRVIHPDARDTRWPALADDLAHAI